ncbi:hypothetical protein PV08_02869 [Exophiala spinifera]|uniref:Xylose isomerase-like TIM barrel domain-containing protein n=1 Tax=Exophiala spinifera TaxID=91928 RepID=A0A0D1YTM5_9EURO|nr:uncharacterized protein PV08_02869 [Exophiala spinifera]KIW18581.1 hypothetical protein PV08_02869 [Exophiala spinifera]
MPLSPKIKLCVGTAALGQHPSHTLERKFGAAASNHFQGVEVVYKDLVFFAESHHVSLIQAAFLIKGIAHKNGIEILSLNPLKMFEGNLNTTLAQRLDVGREWVAIARALGTKLIRVPSQMDPNSTGDDRVLVHELRQLAEIGCIGGEVVSFAYEAVAMGVHNSLWQDSLRIVQAVDRANFGICLDNFHIHARLWGDPTIEGGKLPGGDEAVRKSLDLFKKTCPKEKLFYVQFSGAKLFQPPMKHDDPLFEGLEIHNPILAWSRGARPYPLEPDDYLPVAEVAKAWLVDYGWDGWVSLEGFLAETSLEEFGPERMAARAWQSWQNVRRAIQE